MARMTDIDELLEKVAKIQASGGDAEKRVGEIIIAITNAPTVEIVRCKDCKYRSSGYCAFDGNDFYPYDDSFCSYGVRGDWNGEKE